MRIWRGPVYLHCCCAIINTLFSLSDRAQVPFRVWHTGLPDGVIEAIAAGAFLIGLGCPVYVIDKARQERLPLREWAPTLTLGVLLVFIQIWALAVVAVDW
jgi:hypothetical protein